MSRQKLHTLLCLSAAMLLSPSLPAQSLPLSLVPRPVSASPVQATVPLPSRLEVKVNGPTSTRIQSAVTQVMRQWKAGEGKGIEGATILEISFADAPALPMLGVDESYQLSVTAGTLRLTSKTDIGAIRGLATLALLPLEADGKRVLPVVEIQDAPRFPWRGLMIDVARHWQPLPVIERNLDAMALVKLNVLHLHLTEDQGFRVESKTHPELHLKGSDGHYFTQDDIRHIIALANERGIRVVPEFDIPGHATSWVVSHPELASLPGPYEIERGWGIFNPVLDPTNEGTYALLADFLGEMAALFPDPVLHIGGDENNGIQWNANPHIQNFIVEKKLQDNAGLHAYFNRRVAAILVQHGKRLMGWDEILHPDLPKDAIVHSWRGPKGLAEAAKSGRQVVLSNGYYIDLCFPTEDHYLNDPLPADSPLTGAEKALVLGGEATMWAEWVNPETIDSRIWPRTAAIAERLWSPQATNDLEELHRRLPRLSAALTSAGLQQQTGPAHRIRNLVTGGAPDAEFANLAQVVRALEPVKQYRRGGLQPEGNQLAPLDTLADMTLPDSRPARRFAALLEQLFHTDEPARSTALASLQLQLEQWSLASSSALKTPLADTRAAREFARQARLLQRLSDSGLKALESLKASKPASEAELREAAKAFFDATRPDASATEFVFIEPLRQLMAFSAAPARLAAFKGAERKAALEKLAPPLSE